MTSLDVAQTAASSTVDQPKPQRTPGQITDRKELWIGGTIEITVPAVVRAGVFRDEERGVEIRFIQFARTVKGGVVNFFIHTDNPDLYAGKTISADVAIHQKSYADGRSFIYVDLTPVEGSPNKRLIIEDRQHAPTPHGVVVAFTTPPPLRARIIIAPLKGEKIKPTGDAQLDRYLKDGWNIQHQDAKAVYLTKGDRNLTHHKKRDKNHGRR